VKATFLLFHFLNTGIVPQYIAIDRSLIHEGLPSPAIPEWYVAGRNLNAARGAFVEIFSLLGLMLRYIAEMMTGILAGFHSGSLGITSARIVKQFVLENHPLAG